MARSSPEFSTIRTEGAMLPADILRRIAAGDVEGLRPADYGLPGSMKLNEAISGAWTRARGHWQEFSEARAALGDHDETATVVTRQKWLQPLLEILGFGRLSPGKGQVVEEKSYPIQFVWQQVPLHLLGCRVPIDRRTRGVAGAATGSPHSMVQEFLNRSEAHLWAVVTNGLQWRLLRDNHALSRQAFVEFDLEAMMQGEVYSDFALLWTLCHASRFEGETPERCRLERWSRLAVTDGVKILGGLRISVAQAIESLGQGFVGHPDNHELRELLRDGRLSTQTLYREVLRQVYRLLFLFVAEDRDLLHAPEIDGDRRELYRRHYSTRRLREMADRVRGTAHGDLWQALSLVYAKLGSAEGCPELGLPSLGSFLWDAESTRHLNAPSTPGAASFPCTASIDNEHLLSAIRDLAYAEVDGLRRIVDYRNLGAEELGSVYEGLLELVPSIVAETTAEASRFELRLTAGNDRKQSGSYYTPDSLVQCLLDSALEPVVADRLEGLASPAERAAAILSITVCDPAVGSGHFLIAAAHRLAAHLARHRTGDQEPAPEDYRSALREVIRTCLYGIDINPMAAELCRVSLWIESMEPGKPLSFLEHHIRVGNSLVGVTPELLAKGIPDGAFKAIEGDDKKTCSALKKRNKQERDAKQEMFDFGAAPAPDLSTPFSSLSSGSDDTITAVSRRRRQYEGLLASDDYRNALLVADAWCAAFFWRKDGAKIGGIEGLTQALLREIEQHPERFPPGNEVRDEIDCLAAENQFLHLHLAYPEIANAPNAAARGRMIKAIAHENPLLHRQFESARRDAEAQSSFLRSSDRFPLCGRGDVNLYTVFAESMRDSVSPTGRAGMIVPSGVATDDTTKFFFQDLVERASLVSLFDFENRQGLFEAVDSRMKFACVTLRAPAPDDHAARSARPAEFVFFAHRVEDITDDTRRFTLTRDDIALVNPNTRTCPIFRTKVDAELTKHIYRRVPVLVDETTPDGNPWGVEFSTMFHMSNDSHLFRTREQLETDGWTLRGNVFVHGEERYLPLYEAKMIHHFDHRWGTYDGLDTRDMTDADRVDPSAVVMPRYWVPQVDVASRLEDRWSRDWLLGWRDITNTTNERTVIAGVFPRCGVGNKIPLMLCGGLDASDAASLTACLSSFAFDFPSRQKVGGTTLNFFIYEQLPVLPPELLSQQTSNSSWRDWIAPRVLELSATADDMAPFSRDLWPEGDGAVFRWDPDRRFEIRCELDAAFFHLYLGSPEEWRRTASPELLAALPTPRDAIASVMETFPIVKRKDVDAHGTYRTKDRILALYDRLQECLASGTPFTSELDPPPGPPTNPDSSFRALPPWPKGAPRPADYPSHIHPPIAHRHARAEPEAPDS